MSRFGLRSSHTDATHKEEYEDDDEQTTTTTIPCTTTTTNTTTAAATTKIAQKRIYQKKKKKTITTINNDKPIKATMTSATETTTTTTANTNTTSAKMSLMCSLPLTRLSGIIEKLQLKNKVNANKKALAKNNSATLQQQQKEERDNNLFDSLKLSATATTTTTTTTTTQRNEEENVVEAAVEDEEVEVDEEDEEEEEEDLQAHHHQQQQQQQQHEEQPHKNNLNNNQINAQNSIVGKLMCLYCDKKFISVKLQSKHVEKIHLQARDRRLSGRNMSNNQLLDEQATTNTTTIATATTSANNNLNMNTTTSLLTTTTSSNRRHNALQQQQIFPNCNYCRKINTTTTPIYDDTTTEINLNALFMHLVECHSDKYYACKICMLRFPNNNKLQKHKQILHLTTTMLPCQQQQSQQQCDDDDNDDTDSIATTTTTQSSISNNNNSNELLQQQQQQTTTTTTVTKRSLRLLQQQHSLDNSNSTDTCSSAPTQLSHMTTEEPTILSRLGLAQNRFCTKRKSGMRLRREATIGSVATALRSNRGNVGGATTTTTLLAANLNKGNMGTTLTTTTTTTTGITTTTTMTTNVAHIQTESPTREVLFRMPTRNETTTTTTTYIIDDDFYKEVVNNVRHNLLYYLDGKLHDNTSTTTTTTTTTNEQSEQQSQQPLPVVRSTVVLVTDEEEEEDNRELHAASCLNAITAFPTLLTAEQYGGDALTKLRKAHTKHSWKWKWDRAKKYKLINEGGKIVKKMKPLLGLRDLSKLDMWTQLTMRQKFEEQQQQQQHDMPNEIRLEKLRLNEQLNMILDKRLLPQISLEQNEQTIIKNETQTAAEVLHMPCGNMLEEDFEDHIQKHELHNFIIDNQFLSALQLNATHATCHPSTSTQASRLVLSGEWARPRCYMCMLCGMKFDKLKSLEEHKMFRHSHIYCTHYEVVGRELLSNNLLRHLFLPKKALARYNANLASNYNERNCNFDNSLMTSVEDESSDSLQSTTTITTTTQLTPLTPQLTEQIVSPTHSLQSCSSVTSFARQVLSPVNTPPTPTVLRTPNKLFNNNNNNNNNISNNSNNNSSDVCSLRVCTKCQRKCSGAMDLYRHMLDCSGDYIWSMVKKRKYRYYCGSKKRRRNELRKTPKQQHPPKTPDMTQKSSSSSSNQPTPRQRPSDGKIECNIWFYRNFEYFYLIETLFPLNLSKFIEFKTIKQNIYKVGLNIIYFCRFH